MRHLEYEIARLETELSQGGHLDVVNGADILLQMPTGLSHQQILDSNGQRPPTAGGVSLHEVGKSRMRTDGFRASILNF